MCWRTSVLLSCRNSVWEVDCFQLIYECRRELPVEENTQFARLRTFNHCCLTGTRNMIKYHSISITSQKPKAHDKETISYNTTALLLGFSSEHFLHFSAALDSPVSEHAAIQGPKKLDVLLSLQMMEPRTIHLCHEQASLHLLCCSSHLLLHLSQKHTAAKWSL